MLCLKQLLIYPWRSQGEWRVRTPFVVKCNVIFNTLFKYYKICISYIIFSKFRLLFNAFN